MEMSIEESAARLNTADRLSALGIPELSPSALFDELQIDELSPLLLAYFPLGFVVAALRMALWVAGVALDASWFRQPSVIGGWLNLLGVSVTWTDQQNIPEEQRHVLVSNHVSVGDLLVLFQQPQRYVHLITNALPQQFETAEHVISAVGFMLFADKLPVVPVALRVRPALPQVKCHTLTSSFLANLFWFSFQPWTRIEAKALPPMQLQPGESKAAFVQRVELAIAEELRVWVTDLSIQQKRQKVKQRQQHQRQQRKNKT
eukprot:gene6685-6908_t